MDWKGLAFELEELSKLVVKIDWSVDWLHDVWLHVVAKIWNELTLLFKLGKLLLVLLLVVLT